MIDPAFIPRIHHQADTPSLGANWALFLDLDGTLIDIARTPSEVAVPFDLVKHLAAVSAGLNGALGIVSGRTISEIDQLLMPLRIPAAGEHGAVIRLPDGAYDEVDARVPYEWVERLVGAVAGMSGVLIERKSHCLAVHYRRAPRYGDMLASLARDLVARAPDAFELLEAKMAVEIRPRAVNKGRAVELLMSRPPFRNRVPVFIGDDVTDQDGFAAARLRGGMGFDVGRYFAGRPEEVRRWLKTAAERWGTRE